MHSDVFPVPPIYIFPTHIVFILYFFLIKKLLIKFIKLVKIVKGFNKYEIKFFNILFYLF